MMARIKPLILLLGILGGLFFMQLIVLAQNESEVRLTISPLRFELTANPGDEISNRVRIFNPTGNVISVKMEFEDFRPVGEEGQVVVAPEEEATYSLKRWIEAEPAEFTLEPHENKFVEFVISVPENAEPGGKYGSILATITGIISGERMGTAIATKIGSLVLLTVSGEVREDILVREFSAPQFSEYGPISFVLRFENKGTVHVRPKGFITIFNWRGKKVANVEIPQSNIIPGAVRKSTAVWEEEWLFGKYTATLIGSYGVSNTPLELIDITFWAFPWKIGLWVLGGAIIIFVLLYLTRKRWRLALRVLLKGERGL